MFVFAVGLVIAATTAHAWACSISLEPSAWVQQHSSGAPAGNRPWIVLWRVPGKIQITLVKEPCASGKLCPGTTVPYQRYRNFVRPRSALPDGARFQVAKGNRLLVEATVGGSATALPEWAGIDLVSAKDEPAGLCSPAGPKMRLKVRDTAATLDGAVLLVWLRKPNLASPAQGLVQVLALGSDPELGVGNQLGAAPIFRKVPNHLWVAIADGDGRVGTPTRLP